MPGGMFKLRFDRYKTAVLFIGGYSATQMLNSTNVESERFSDYFNPMLDINNDTFNLSDVLQQSFEVGP